MVNGAWVCLLAPLAGFLAIMLAGTRITRRQAGIISTASVFVGFAGAVVAFIDALGARAPTTAPADDRVDVARRPASSRSGSSSSSTRSRS